MELQELYKFVTINYLCDSCPLVFITMFYSIKKEKTDACVFRQKVYSAIYMVNFNCKKDGYGVNIHKKKNQ